MQLEVYCIQQGHKLYLKVDVKNLDDFEKSTKVLKYQKKTVLVFLPKM